MTFKLTRLEWCSLGAGLLIALAFLVHQRLYPSTLYDAGQYSRMARDIAEHGLFARFSASALRTYGYPVLLSFVYRAADLVGLGFRDLLFVVQLGLYVSACFFVRRRLSAISPAAARIAFCGMLTNYYVVIYTPEPLTETLSLILLLVSAGCWLAFYTGVGKAWPLVIGTMTSGFTVMVRPANLFIPVAWIVGVIVIGLRRRFGRLRLLVTVSCVVAAVALPMLPQLAYNVLRFGKWTPLLAQDLGGMQVVWGIQDIKYATVMPPSPEPRVHYVNPFWVGTSVDESAPWRWYLDHPGRGALTLAIHTFNLTDQDLLFTYSRDLDPWYRIPLGVVNHAFVALGLIGLGLAVPAMRRAEMLRQRDAFFMLLLTLAANWAMHVWTAVEMRFGVVLLLALVPFAGYAAVNLGARRNRRLLVFAGLAVACYTVLALSLSSWVREQSPLIRAARSGRAGLSAPAQGGTPEARFAEPSLEGSGRASYTGR